MMMKIALVALYFVTAAFGDQITVTLVDQVTQVSASAGNGAGQSCNESVSGRGATCSVPGALASAFFEPGFAYPGATFGYVLAEPENPTSYASASTSVSDTVLIAGGTGTGYLNLSVNTDRAGASSSTTILTVTVNGQNAVPGEDFPDFLQGVFTFQFGQPFKLDASASISSNAEALATMAFAGAQVYTVQPTSCSTYDGLCSDPNFTSANILGEIYGVDGVPEPNTIWMAFASVPAALLVSRARRSNHRIAG